MSIMLYVGKKNIGEIRYTYDKDLVVFHNTKIAIKSVYRRLAIRLNRMIFKNSERHAVAQGVIPSSLAPFPEGILNVLNQLWEEDHRFTFTFPIINFKALNPERE